MALVIDLTAEEECRLREEAAAQGLAPERYAHRLLAGALAIPQPRRVSALGRAVGRPGGTEEFLQSKHAEKAREAQRWRAASAANS